MSTPQHFDEKRFAALLKKSEVQPLSPDFDDKLMAIIMKTPAATPIVKNGTALQLGKRYLILAAGFLVVSVFISGQFLSGYFNGLTLPFSLATNYIFFGGMVLLIPVLLFILDLFLQEKQTNRDLVELFGI